MKENWRFILAFSVLCAGFALFTVMTVYHTIAVHPGITS